MRNVQERPKEDRLGHERRKETSPERYHTKHLLVDDNRQADVVYELAS